MRFLSSKVQSTKNRFRLSVFVFAILTAFPAFGVVDAQLLIGKGPMDVESSPSANETAVGGFSQPVDEVQDVTLAIHLDPWFAVPIGLGGFATSRAFTLTRDEAHDPITGKMSGLLYGPEAMAWLPLGWVSPYAKAAYIFGDYLYTIDGERNEIAGTYSVKGESRMSVRGWRGSVGLKLRPAPTFAVVVEYAAAEEEVSIESQQYIAQEPGQDPVHLDVGDSNSTISAASRTILVGVEVGI